MRNICDEKREYKKGREEKRKEKIKMRKEDEEGEKMYIKLNNVNRNV